MGVTEAAGAAAAAVLAAAAVVTRAAAVVTVVNYGQRAGAIRSARGRLCSGRGA